MNNQKYPKSMRLMHWIIFLLLIAQFTLGFVMDDDNPTSMRAHVILGVTVLGLTALRFGLKSINKHNIPAKPASLSEKGWTFAKIGHVFLYIALIATPVAGLIGYYGRSHDILEIHETLIWVLLALIGGHAAMVFVHKFRSGENLIKRMS